MLITWEKVVLKESIEMDKVALNFRINFIL